MNKIQITFTLALFFAIGSFAQSSPHLLRATISATGSSSTTNNKHLVQQSVGQSSPVGVQQISNHTIRQGFIQPTQLKRMLAASSSSDLSVSVYPNPTIDNITLSFEELVSGKVNLSIYDEMGRLVLMENKEAQVELSYSLANLVVGNYFVKVNATNKQYVTQIAKQQ